MDKKKSTANEFASHFEVSKRTILRDIDTLTMAGIPIYTTQGKGGGIFMQDNFVLNKTFISKDEQKQILFSLQSMSVTEFAFDYLSAYGESKGREVYPLKLSFKSKAWYLQSFCSSENDYRTYKFNRMSNITILDESFNGKEYEIPKIEPLENPSSLRYVELKLNVSSLAKHRIYDEFAESDITINNDGTFTLRIAEGQWLYDYILSYGTAVEVLEPQYVRDEMMVRIEKIKNLYLLKT
jgi:predicted DNA-binding transcriptional regulator YafY